MLISGKTCHTYSSYLIDHTLLNKRKYEFSYKIQYEVSVQVIKVKVLILRTEHIYEDNQRAIYHLPTATGCLRQPATTDPTLGMYSTLGTRVNQSSCGI